MTYLNYVWRILTKNQKKRSLILFFLILVSTFLEVLGIGLIVPVILFFIEDDIVTKYPFLNSIVGYFFYEPSKIDYIKFGLISLLSILFPQSIIRSLFIPVSIICVTSFSSCAINNLSTWYVAAFIKMIFVYTLIAMTSISLGYMIFFDPTQAFNNILEWNYFCFLLFFYFLSSIIWKNKNQ